MEIIWGSYGDGDHMAISFPFGRDDPFRLLNTLAKRGDFLGESGVMRFRCAFDEDDPQ